jgi:hypothetical protein
MTAPRSPSDCDADRRVPRDLMLDLGVQQVPSRITTAEIHIHILMPTATPKRPIVAL